MSKNREMRLNWENYPEIMPEMGFITKNMAGISFCVGIVGLNEQKLWCLDKMEAKLS